MKSLLNISDLSKTDFFEIINSIDIPSDFDNCLLNKNIGLIFEKNSTRTRLSFQVGINQLNGNFININLKDLNLDRIESFEDTFEIMACYLDCLVFRTVDHSKLKIAKKYFKKPVINALSDISHPCQAISDIFTLIEHFNRKDNFNIVWLGDLNNVLYSLIETIDFFESSYINIFTDKDIYKNKQRYFDISEKVNFLFDTDNKILANADCIMTDVYNSMNDRENKEKKLIKFQVNELLMNNTKKECIFMHCLPAKIGSEVTENVIKGSKSIVIQQAKNRMVTQKGILKWLDI